MLYSKKNIFLGLILLYAFLGFFLVPYLLKPQVILAIKQNTKASISIERISFNPFVFSLELSGVRLEDAQEQEALFFKSLYINIDPGSFFYGALHIKNITLREPKLSVVYNKDKTLNLLKLLKKDLIKKTGV